MPISKKTLLHLSITFILVVRNLYTVNETGNEEQIPAGNDGGKGKVIESVVQSAPYGLGLSEKRPSAWEKSCPAVNPLGFVDSQVKGKNTSCLVIVIEEECEEFMKLKESQVKGRNASALMGSTKEQMEDLIDFGSMRSYNTTVGEWLSLDMGTLRYRVCKVVWFLMCSVTPCLQSGVGFSMGKFHKYDELVMVVPKESGEANTWAFVKPFTPGMWWATVAILIYTALVVWLLELKINPVAHIDVSITEVFIIIWSTISTMSLSQDVKIESRSARFVIGVWVLVMYIIGSSYTDNYNLRLNAQKTNPTITITSPDEFVSVGYLKHHIKQDDLRRYLHIDLRDLKAYVTAEECAQALSLGPSNGGVAAVFMDAEDALNYFSDYTIYHILDTHSPPEADQMPKRLGVKDFLGWFIITATVSMMVLIISFFNLLRRLRRDADTTGEGIDSLEMEPSAEEESVQAMGIITNISDAEDSTLIEASSLHIPHDS